MSRPASLLLVLALLAGTAVAFAETERLKVSSSPVESSYVQPEFSPVCRCAKSKATIRLRLHHADVITVTVLNSRARTVRALVSARHVPAGRVQLHWDGRDGAGAIVPDGAYSVHVELALADRTIDLPKDVVVDTVAPTIRLVGYRPHVLARRSRRRVVVHYRVSESAQAILLVNGRRALRTHTTATSAKFDWFARSGGRRLRPGRYRLQLAGLDLAGNLGPRTPLFVVTVR